MDFSLTRSAASPLPPLPPHSQVDFDLVRHWKRDGSRAVKSIARAKRGSLKKGNAILERARTLIAENSAQKDQGGARTSVGKRARFSSLTMESQSSGTHGPLPQTPYSQRERARSRLGRYRLGAPSARNHAVPARLSLSTTSVPTNWAHAQVCLSPLLYPPHSPPPPSPRSPSSHP